MVQHDNDQYGEENADDRDSGSLARTVRLISGEYLLTVNPVDGSEIEPCPPGQRPGPPRRRPRGEQPPAGSGAPSAEPSPAGAGALGGGTPANASTGAPTGADRRSTVLLERGEERERLTRLLGRGRSVRLTGPRGSGRTALLDAVATDVADLAPDGVIRLSGYRRNVTEVLYDLFAAVYDTPGQRPERHRLREALSAVGAVVVLDDAEFGGSTLDELLTATPECAFVIATTPDVAAPSEQSRVEEIFLSGLSRTGSLELLEEILGRPLTDDESDWAGDLWFLSEGNPLSFLQAGALLRQRGGGTALAVYGSDAAAESDGGLPSGVDLAADVAAGTSRSARAVLRTAMALGGEVPRETHLPAILGEDHADQGPSELADAGLVTQAGGHYRLAHGVAAQLAGARVLVGPDAPAGASGDEAACAEAVAQHYAWWVAHPSVSAGRVADEADVLVATVQAAQRGDKAAAAARLARAAAPVLAATARWGAWERVLRSGQEAARRAGEVAEQAYFHHELGVLALCQGNPERAHSELDASIALRAALADRHGTVAGRRALALVEDRIAAGSRGGAAGVTPGTSDGPTPAGGHAGDPPPPARGVPGEPSARVRTDKGPGAGSADPGAPGAKPATSPLPGVASAPGAGTGTGATAGAGTGTGPARPDDVATSPTPRLYGSGPRTQSQDEVSAALSKAAEMDDSIAALRASEEPNRGIPRLGGRRGLAINGTRKNVLAAGAGAVLAAVLGMVVTIGAASDGTDTPPGGPPQPGQSDSLTDGWGDDPGSTPDDDADEASDPSREPGTPGPSSEANPAPTPSSAPGVPADDPSSPRDDDSTDGGSGNGGPGGGSGGSSGSGGTDGGSDGGTDGGADGGSQGGADGGTEGGSENGGSGGGSPSPSPSGSETPDPSTSPSATTDGSDGSSSPAVSGPVPSPTPGDDSPSGDGTGGTGGEVV